KFSRSSSFSRCRSSVARPGRFPRSRSAWTTHLRRDSGAHPIFEAIERIAAHCESYWSPCSRTIRTARSRTSGEKLLGRPMDSILPQNGVSGKPGTVHSDRSSAAPDLLPWCKGRGSLRRLRDGALRGDDHGVL